MYKNKFLIANPIITDPIFSQSVIFLLMHDPKGAQGIILNSTKEFGLIKFASSKDPKNTLDLPLFCGGPCKTGIYFIHGHEESYDHEEEFQSQKDDEPEFDLGLPTSFDLGNEFDSEYGDNHSQQVKNKLKIMDGVYFGTPMAFSHIIELDKVKENKFRFYMGMSSWGPGQLEREIAGGAWKITDSDPDQFFDIKSLNKMVGKVEVEKLNLWNDRFKPSMN